MKTIALSDFELNLLHGLLADEEIRLKKLRWKMKYKSNKFNYFLKILLDSADLVETFDIINPFTDGLGLGIRSYPRYIRQGVKEIIDLKQENMNLKDDLEFVEDLLGEYREAIPLDPEDLTDENKKEIKKFAEKLLDEVEDV